MDHLSVQYPQKFTNSPHIANFFGVEDDQDLRGPVFIHCVPVHEQVHRSCPFRVQSQEPFNPLVRLALVAEDVPENAGAQLGDINAFRELGQADQTLSIACVELGQVGVAAFIFGVVGVFGLLFSLLLGADEAAPFP